MTIPPTTSVGIVGAGTMGAGIAQVAARAGHPVRLFDAAPGQAEKAVAGVGKRLHASVARGRSTAEEADEVLARLVVADGLADLAECGVVIEAAAEVLEIKRDILTALEEVVGPDCVLASNTSSLSISALAAVLARPERCVGMHFFNPAPVMQLVEVVSGLATAPDMADAAVELCHAWGKQPVRVLSTPGFVVNRVIRPFYGEGLRALDEGTADPATVDAVLREVGGFPMGPCELTDLIGQDVNLAVTRSVWAAFAFDPRYAPSLAQQALVDAGRLGRKSGRGFYDYSAAGRVATPAGSKPRVAPAGSARVTGNWGAWSPLWDRVSAAGADISFVAALSGFPDEHAPMAELEDGVLLIPTRGRSATAVAASLGRPVVTLDLTCNASAAERYAIAPSDGMSTGQLESATELLSVTGAAVTVLDDVPGLLAARTVAMLVNEAADVVGRGVASATDVDLAVQLGANHPRGPLAWGDELGATWVVDVLDALDDAYRDGRYRACPFLRRAALSGKKLT